MVMGVGNWVHEPKPGISSRAQLIPLSLDLPTADD
jgi:hypothetical protein